MSRETRYYALFEKRNNKAGRTKWIRISEYAYHLTSASKIFQSALLDSAMGFDYERRLRPVKERFVKLHE